MADRMEGVEAQDGHRKWDIRAQDGHRKWGYQNLRWPLEVEVSKLKVATGSHGIRAQDGHRKWGCQSPRWPPEVGVSKPKMATGSGGIEALSLSPIVAVRCPAALQDAMLDLSPTLQALAHAGPVELLPQGAGPEVGPGWVGAPAGTGIHVHICLQVSSIAGGGPWDCGILEDQGWEDCSALWDAGGPRGWGGTAMHCGMLEDPIGLWNAGGSGVDCSALWDAGGLRWEDHMGLWDAGGPRVGGPQCTMGYWEMPMHCGMPENLGWEDPKALWDVRGWGYDGMLEDPGGGPVPLWDLGGP